MGHLNNRRRLLQTGGILAMGALAPWRVQAAESHLIYLSPVKRDGSLSRCQAEVWYVQSDADMYVVTASSAWRAEAPRQGLTRTQVWVGDVGVWSRSRGKYKELPSLMTEAQLVDDPAVHARLLERFGVKYASEWGTWGPRFKNGLADGSRVMLRYSPV